MATFFLLYVEQTSAIYKPRNNPLTFATLSFIKGKGNRKGGLNMATESEYYAVWNDGNTDDDEEYAGYYDYGNGYNYTMTNNNEWHSPANPVKHYSNMMTKKKEVLATGA